MLNTRLRLLLLDVWPGRAHRYSVAPLKILLAQGILVQHRRPLLVAVQLAAGLQSDVPVDQAVPALALEVLCQVPVPARPVRERVHVALGEYEVLLGGRAAVAVRIHLTLWQLRVETVDRWLVSVVVLAAVAPFPCQGCVSVGVGAAGAYILNGAPDVTIGFDVYHLLRVRV